MKSIIICFTLWGFAYYDTSNNPDIANKRFSPLRHSYFRTRVACSNETTMTNNLFATYLSEPRKRKSRTGGGGIKRRSPGRGSDRSGEAPAACWRADTRADSKHRLARMVTFSIFYQ